MNKFDEMMALLCTTNKRFAQVIAVDAKFDLFTRAWCVSELAQADSMGMKQHLKRLNFRCLDENSDRLRQLRVENMQASRKEDIDEILNNILDVAAFNNNMQTLLFQKIIPQWQQLDARDQMARIGQIVRWQCLVSSRNTYGMYAQRQDDGHDTESRHSGPHIIMGQPVERVD